MALELQKEKGKQEEIRHQWRVFMHSNDELKEMEARERQKKEKDKVNAVKRKLQFEQLQREEEEKKKEKEHKIEREGSKRKGSKQHQENIKWRWLACFHLMKSLLLRKVGYIYIYL